MKKLLLNISINCKKNPLLIIMMFSIIFLILLALIIYPNSLTEKRISGSYIKLYTSYSSFWINDGFWKYCGFFYNPADLTRTWQTEPYIYGTAPGWFLYFPYIAQHLNYFFTGSIEPKFIAYHGVLSSFVAGITLSYLGYKIVDILVPKYYFIKMVLSIISLMVFVTFPHNLFLIYSPSPQINFITLSSLFFIKFINLFNRDLIINKLDVVHLFLICLLMNFTEPVASIFFQICLLIVLFFSFKYKKSIAILVIIFIASGLTFLLIKEVQTLIAEFNNPNIKFLSTGTLARSGLDGTSSLYSSHWDLLFNRRLSGMHTTSTLPKWYMDWPVIFIMSIMSLLAIVYFEVRKLTVISFILFTGYSSYFLYAFIFSNAVIVHADLYDVILFAPVVLTVFSVLPAYIYKFTSSILVLPIWIIGGICYAFVQLRLYAIAYPPV
jgi:hypothetical protein